MSRALLALAVLFAIIPARAEPQRSDELAVEARNLSTPELCAEKDNVEIDLVSPQVRQFRLQAIHPAYIGTIVTDRWAPDLTSCNFQPDAQTFADKGERITLWESPMMQLVGYRIPEFWRPATVPVRVGDKSVTGLQIVQLWVNYRERAEEVLVFYPPDGYFRARPLPYEDMRWTAYGSSFLIGPVEVQERPIVALKEISFDPQTKTLNLMFKRGGAAHINLEKIDQEHISLDVSYDGAMPDGLPFAALRSMYAREQNADVADISWREKGGKTWKESGVMNFKTTPVVELWAGRRVLSRHNMSAPDMSFSRFSDKATKPADNRPLEGK
ncbi:MAG: hypothetical protein KGL46_00685 [Hyphomicrobiales bacterium]|nr:hypothetical protein [Hyphomicrobiales bacterium]